MHQCKTRTIKKRKRHKHTFFRSSGLTPSSVGSPPCPWPTTSDPPSPAPPTSTPGSSADWIVCSQRAALLHGSVVGHLTSSDKAFAARLCLAHLPVPDFCEAVEMTLHQTEIINIEPLEVGRQSSGNHFADNITIPHCLQRRLCDVTPCAVQDQNDRLVGNGPSICFAFAGPPSSVLRVYAVLCHTKFFHFWWVSLSTSFRRRVNLAVEESYLVFFAGQLLLHVPRVRIKLLRSMCRSTP